MMAYRIEMELRRSWTSRNVTVDEGLAELSSLCMNEVTILDLPTINQIPEPRLSVQNLLNAADVKIPDVLPYSGTKSHTTTKSPQISKRKKTEYETLPRFAASYEADYTAVEVREIFRLIDWMHLRPDLNWRFKSELIAYEKEMKMPSVTSVERLAKEEGREEGSVAILLHQLTRLCGALPEDIQLRVRQLPSEQLEDLGESLFDSSRWQI